MSELKAWLEGLGLGEYEQVFAQQKVDGETLPELTDGDLKELGVPLGHRKKLLKAIAALAADHGGANAMSDSASAAERRQLTVMFCDLVGSTALSQRLDPEDLRELIRAYQRACTAAIQRYEGFVARYIGDGILAYFGYPRSHEDDPERAIHAGLAATEAVSQLTVGRDEALALAARVGVATGLVVVGDLIGEGASEESAVVGETPNLAARLQALATPNTVVVAPSTRRLAGGGFTYEDLGVRELKGLLEPVQTWRVIGESAVESRFDAVHGARLTPLVGRKEEEELLLRRWRQAKRGEGQVVLISGEAGIGKSRLTQVLRELSTEESSPHLSYQCSPHHTNSALFPVIGQLERTAGFSAEADVSERLEKLKELLSRSNEDLERDLPLIAALLSMPTLGRYPALELEPQRQREETLVALLRQLEGLCRYAAVLQVFEDVHWIDPSSMEFLERLVERVHELPVLLVITFRPEFHAPWTGHSHTTLLALRRMSRRESVALVHEVTGRKTLPTEILEQIVSKTDGVPLFVEELTKAVLESTLLVDEGAGYALAGPLPPLAVPESLHDSLMARLDRLAPVKEVAQLAATIGRTFSHRLLSAASSLSEGELDDVLGRLIDAELVFRRGSPAGITYEFKHALVRDTAYQSLLRGVRQQHHRRIAAMLEERFPETVETEPEILAHHFTEAGSLEKAIDYWQRAGRRARDRSANPEAVAHFTRALELLQNQPESRDRDCVELDLQVDLGGPLLMTGGHTSPEVEHVYARARELAQVTGRQGELVPVLFGLWRYYCAKPLFQPAAELATQLLENAQGTGEPADHVIARYALGFTQLYMGQPAEARGHFESGWSFYEPGQRRSPAFQQGQDPGVGCAIYGGKATWIAGYPDTARTWTRQGIHLAEELEHPFSQAFTLNTGATLWEIQGEIEHVRGMAGRGLELANDQGFSVWAAFAKVHHGWALARVGHGTDSAESIERGIQETRQLGVGALRPYLLYLLGDAYEVLGQREHAMQALNEALEVSEANNEHWWDAELLRRKGALLVGQPADGPRDAEFCFERALDIARTQQAKSLELRAAVSLARLWNDAGKREEAHGLLTPVYEWFSEGFDTVDLKEAKALLGQLSA